MGIFTYGYVISSANYVCTNPLPEVIYAILEISADLLLPVVIVALPVGLSGLIVAFIKAITKRESSEIRIGMKALAVAVGAFIVVVLATRAFTLGCYPR